MASPPEPPRIARFGVFEVDLQGQELRRAGLKIRLHEQPFQVLAALLESAGDVVTRDELHRRIWPGGTFVDFESGLNTAVNKVREALGDSANSPRFIETVPRRGYRFLATVDGLVNGNAAPQLSGEESRANAGTLQSGTAHPAIAANSGARWRWIALATFAAGLLGGWFITNLREPDSKETAFRAEIDPPAGGRFSFGLGIGGIALSPDGRTADFVVSTNGKTALWLRPLDGTSSRLVPETEGAAFPFWSPDSRSIAFFAAGKLQRLDIADGTLTAICDAQRGWGGAWTADGQIIFSAFGFGLRRVSASGGTPAPFTKLDAARGEGLHLWPQVLPGNRFLFFVQSHKAEDSGVYAALSAKPDERIHLLTTDAKAVYAAGAGGRDYLVWQRAGILVAQEFDARALKLKGDIRTLGERVAVFGGGLVNVAVSGGLLLCANARTLMQLTWFNRKGKALGVLGESGEYVYFRLSPNGREAAAARTKPDGRDLWLVDADRGVADRLTSSPGLKGYPVWSSNSRAVLFASGAPYNLFAKGLAGGDEYRITRSANYQVPNDASRGGRLLLYTEIGPGTGFDLWTLPVDADGRPVSNAKPRPYLRTPFNEWNGRFSPEPEPRLVAYESDESGRYDVYVDSFPQGRNKTAISTGGDRYPQWSPDGHKLFYVSPDGSLMEVSLDRRADSIAVSSPRKLFALPVIDTGLSPYEVAPNGQRFLVRAESAEKAEEPLTLIVNWPALLKRGAASQ